MQYLSPLFNTWMKNGSLTDWVTDWLTDWLTGRFVYWMTEWLNEVMNEEYEYCFFTPPF